MKRAACLAILLASLLAGCSTGLVRARVLDAETRQPIPGVVVLGVWTRVVGLGLYHHETVGVRETETDAHGWFELEPLESSGDGQAITVYKGGYVAWSNLFIFPRSVLRASQRVPEEIFLERFPAGQSHKQHVDFISGATRGESSPEKTPKFWNAVRPEHLQP